MCRLIEMSEPSLFHKLSDLLMMASATAGRP
jgi:hypothetical protein